MPSPADSEFVAQWTRPFPLLLFGGPVYVVDELLKTFISKLFSLLNFLIFVFSAVSSLHPFPLLS